MKRESLSLVLRLLTIAALAVLILEIHLLRSDVQSFRAYLEQNAVEVTGTARPTRNPVQVEIESRR